MGRALVTTPEYAELHCHSAYSMLDGATLPERLAARAAALGLYALALTDHDDLGGAIRFAQRAAALELPGIVGVELTVQGAHLTLLARTAAGYANLSQLVTASRAVRGQVGVSLECLASHTEGVLCLSGCPRGAIATHLATGAQLGARRMAGQLKALFGRHFVMEVWDHGLPREVALVHQLQKLAKEIGVPWVVTNNVHYAMAHDRAVHDVLTCLRHHVTLSAAGRRLRPNAEWHLKGAEAMARRWRHDLTGLRMSVELADRCTFRLTSLSPALPDTPVPPEFPDADAWLRHLTYDGATRRWETPGPRHRTQLERELALIEARGLSAYFLIMYEIVKFAQSRGILVQGRGSAANSAVCYCLGVTAVDPLRFDLLFERFLSEARGGYPDIDLDIAHQRREEVLQFVYARYGRGYAAMVCEHICFRGRSAVRDAARTLDFTAEEGARLAGRAHRGAALSEADVQTAGFDPKTPRAQALIRVVAGLQGLPRHRSIHVGGFVLSRDPLAWVVPIEPAAMAGRTVIQWDKDDLEAAGLPKFDLLGLGMLTALSIGLGLVRARHGIDARIYTLPQDPAVYDMIGRADTVGVFQIESRAQMNCLPRTKPRTFYELAIQVALIRPGPLQGDMVHPYIRRKRGEEPIEVAHPSLVPILARTLGVPLFQEQGMRLAVAAAGFTAVEADGLRRAMGGQRHRHNLSALTEKLMAGMQANGIEAAYAARVVKQIEGFSTYGFPESHSTSFALLVYASCWLKHHHPAEFLCGLLNAQPMGFYSPATLVKDAQRCGVQVRPPCLLRSAWAAVMEGDAVRLGLGQVRGLGPVARKNLETAVRAQPFIGAEDAVRRAALPREAWVTLAEAGAFGAFISGGRRAALWAVLRLFGHVMPANQQTLPLPLALPEEPVMRFKGLGEVERTAADYRTTGLSCGRHPMAFLRAQLSARRAIPAAQLSRLPNGAWAKVAGLVNTRQRPPAAKGFFFLTLEDETGFVNVVVRPEDFEAQADLLVGAAALWVEGPVSAHQDVWNVKGRRFQLLTLKGIDALPRSYDFR